MALDAEEIQRCIFDPDTKHIDSKSSGGMMHRSGRIAMPITGDGTVVTILWNHKKSFQRDDISIAVG